MIKLSSRSGSLAVSAALALSTIAVVAPHAAASAGGCVVGRYATPPSTVANTGYALCVVLNNGSKVRSVVYCNAFTIGHGPWVTRANTRSTYVCGSVDHADNYPFVGYQTG
jgi:hypothetical protein